MPAPHTLFWAPRRKRKGSCLKWVHYLLTETDPIESYIPGNFLNFLSVWLHIHSQQNAYIIKAENGGWSDVCTISNFMWWHWEQIIDWNCIWREELFYKEAYKLKALVNSLLKLVAGGRSNEQIAKGVVGWGFCRVLHQMEGWWHECSTHLQLVQEIIQNEALTLVFAESHFLFWVKQGINWHMSHFGGQNRAFSSECQPERWSGILLILNFMTLLLRC